MKVDRLTHLGLSVSNLEHSVRFYCEVLGCQEVGRLSLSGQPTARLNSMEDVRIDTVWLERDGWRLELIGFRDPSPAGDGTVAPMNRRGLTHLAFRVDDLDEICRRVVAAGGGILEETRLDLPGPTRVIMAFDPDGIRIEFMEKPGDPGALPAGVRTAGG